MPSRSRGAPKKTTTAKGLGFDHRTNRTRLINRHIDGRPCWWCGRPMYRDPTRNWDGKEFHAEHSRSRSRYGTTGNHADRLMHDTCNKQRGDGRRDHQRPAATITPDTVKGDDIGPLAMGWPPWT